MNLSKVCKKYPEIEHIILNKINELYEKAKIVEKSSINPWERNNQIIVDEYLENYLLEAENIPKYITQVLDNFEEYMDTLIHGVESNYNRIQKTIIGEIIQSGGLTEEFKKRITSYNNIAIYCSSKEPYYELLKEISKKIDSLQNPKEEFVIVALLNKKYKENGIVINLNQIDVSVISIFKDEMINEILENWENTYKELFYQVNRLVGKSENENSSESYKKNMEYQEKLKYFLSEYINLDENKKKYLLEYLNSIVYIEGDEIINTSEKIRNIDETLLRAIKDCPSEFLTFFNTVGRKKFDEKYFEKIDDKESLKIVNLYENFCYLIENNDYTRIEKLLNDNNCNVFQLVEKIKNLNNKYSEYCHRSISENLTDYAKMEREGKIISKIKKGCKIYELRGQPFFGIIHTANANLDNFYIYEKYASEYGEYIDDEELESDDVLDESIVYVPGRERRSCSTIGNDFLGYVKGNQNRNVIHFAISKIDPEDIIISSNTDLDIMPGEIDEDILSRNEDYSAENILDETEGEYGETLIKSFKTDGSPIKFDAIYSFHVNGPTKEEIDTANRFGIDIVWIDVKEYDKQRKEKLILELSKDITEEEANKKYSHYIDGRGYELDEDEGYPSKEDIYKLVKNKRRIITAEEIGKATMPRTLEDIELYEQVQWDLEKICKFKDEEER